MSEIGTKELNVERWSECEKESGEGEEVSDREEVMVLQVGVESDAVPKELFPRKAQTFKLPSSSSRVDGSHKRVCHVLKFSLSDLYS